MSLAALLAALAAALGVAGAWEALGAVDEARPGRALAHLLAPLRALLRDGREPSALERRRLAILGALALMAGGWLLAGPAVGVLAGAAGPWAVRRLLAHRRARRRAALGAGAPAAARALADALVGGHSVRGAVAAAAAGGGVPGATGEELRTAARALDLGDATDAVLERLRRRAADPRWDTIVAAVGLQRRAGGDLAGLLRGVAAAQEEAARVEADAHGVTAQARFTARLVAGLPVGAAGLAELASPGYLGSLVREPLTLWALVAAALLQVTALVAIGRISRVTGR